MLETGVKFADGKELHLFDYAFFSLQKEQCQAGRIVAFRVHDRGEPMVTFQLVGFVNDVLSLPDDVVKDEVGDRSFISSLETNADSFTETHLFVG